MAGERQPLAPAIAALALAAILAVLIDQLDLFTGRTGLINVALWGLPVVAFALGFLRGAKQRRRERERLAAQIDPALSAVADSVAQDR